MDPIHLLVTLALAASTPAQDAAPDRSGLEAAFAARMSGAVLAGHFTDRTQLDLEPAQDRYTLGRVTKLESGKWRFEAKVEYMGREGTFPLELDVLWAGDTPVITLTDFKVPLFGTFTARVMVFEDEYVGVWDGAGHGGKMWGDITRIEQPSAEAASEDQAVHWPSFRGPGAAGHLPGNGAVSWDIETGENILWRVPLPGLSHSSPVVWGERLFLTTAVREAGEAELQVGLYGAVEPVQDEGPQEFRVLCLDKRTGDLVWDRVAWSGTPEFKRHTKGSHAASTVATDGEHVVAFFGSEGLYCYSLAGELEWSVDFGSLDSGWYVQTDMQWGFSSSPVIHGDRVLVQVDVQEGSFVAALDLANGEELWRTHRDDVPTWSTPTVDVREGRAQVICNGYRHTGGYDLETGEPLWWLSGGGDIPVPTPVVAGDLVYLTSDHGGGGRLYAVPALAEGELELSEEGVAWVQGRANYMQTPLVLGDRLYTCRDHGVLFCRDALTGEEYYSERIGGGRMGFTASLVACGDRIYATGEGGEVHVIQAGDSFERLGLNEMGEDCMATPAISEGVLYVRGRRYLTAIGASE